MAEYTKAANAYVAARRQNDSVDCATWFEVAAAYDAGLKHGVEAKRNAVDQLIERERSVIELEERSAHSASIDPK